MHSLLLFPCCFFSSQEHKAVHNVQSDKCSLARANPPPTFIVLYIIGRLSCGLREENSGIGVAEVDE